MRILGFSERWRKLNNELLFTTFRYKRRDKDWQVEEPVQVVFKPRSREHRQPLGIARIIRIEEKNTKKRWSYYPLPGYPNTPDMITPVDAYEDGFSGMHGGGDIDKMMAWLRKSAGIRFYREPIVNKLTLYWVEKFNEKGGNNGSRT